MNESQFGSSFVPSTQSREDIERDRAAEKAVDQGVVSYYGAQVASVGFYPEKTEAEHDDAPISLSIYNPYGLPPEDLEAWRSMNREGASRSARMLDVIARQKIMAIKDPKERDDALREYIAICAKKRQT